MKILCAPDSFKECLSAEAAAHAMAAGVRHAVPDAEIDCCPVADGGEGTLDALIAAGHGCYYNATVTGPGQEDVRARWGIIGETVAIIEMAEAAGLRLVPTGERDPGRTTTRGVGELMRHAITAGARRLIVGLGGSGTVDGGCGMAQALGARFYDRHGRLHRRVVTGDRLTAIGHVDIELAARHLEAVKVTGACDVVNPLLGPDGAAAVYAPQKGAGDAQVERLEEGLAHLAAIVRRDLGVDVANLPGAGAAGGLGAGLVAFAGGELSRGTELVLDALGFDQRLADVDLCLTGEGRLDGQSLAGKACIGVARAAARHEVPVVALVGDTGPGAESVLEEGVSAYRIIGPGLATDESIRRVEELLAAAAGQTARDFATRG